MCYSKHFIHILIMITSFCMKLQAFNLPPINLGNTSFFDGGPPDGPGVYQQEFFQPYHAYKLVDNKGKNLGGLSPTHLNATVLLSQLIFLSDRNFLGVKPGITFLLPYVSNLKVDSNALALSTTKNGWGDFVVGPILSWDLIKRHGKPFFMHFVEFDMIFPTGRYKSEIPINPGNGIFYFNPFWAATLFISDKLSASWRLHYLWCGKNHKTHLQPGQALHMNFALGYRINEKLVVGVNGYYLQQFTNDRLKGVSIPNSREFIFALGPGILYEKSKKLGIFLNLYFETDVENRPKGYKLNLRFGAHLY